MLDLMLKWQGRAWSLGVLMGLTACEAAPVRIGPGSAQLRALIDEHCLSVSTCGCGGELVEEGCADVLTDRWQTRQDEAQRLGLRFDTECWQALETRLPDYACGWPGGSTPLCGSFCAVFHGDREQGQSCEGSDPQASTCAQGLVCAEGSCVAPCTVLDGRARGQTCFDEALGVFDDCAQGLGCNLQSATCQPLAARGQACRDIECEPGLYCEWQEDELRCEPVAEAGQPCNGASCAPGLYCDWQSEPASCRSFAVAGEACIERPCADALWCNDRGVCVTAPGQGDPCLQGSICDANLVCDPSSSTCVTPPDAGAGCLQGRCATGAWCDTLEVPEGICAPAEPSGQMCSGHRQCQSGYCPNGFCWPLPEAGESCEGTEVCAAGLVCSGQVCEPTITRAPAACSYPGW